MTTILLADDHAVVRHGLRSLLSAEPDFSIVGEAVDGLEAVDLAARRRSSSAGRRASAPAPGQRAPA